jgi:hypothetical protein
MNTLLLLDYKNVFQLNILLTVYQYSETNVMHFIFNLLRIKGLYMFRTLLADPQEALHKRHLVQVYCMRVMSVGCTRIGPILVQPTDVTHTAYTKCFLQRLLKMSK